jgi:hypothetical protein
LPGQPPLAAAPGKTSARSALSVAAKRVATLACRRCAPAGWRVGALALLLAPAAHALINPQFTPVHLTQGAGFIAVLQPALQGNTNGLASLAVVETLKGAPCKEVKIDLSATDPDQRKAALKLLAKAQQEHGLALFFSGKSEKGEAVAYLSLDAQWLELQVGENATWPLVSVASDMLATWNGSVDMLLRCVRYVLAFPDAADVPAAEGMAWRNTVQVGRVAGAPTSLDTPDLAGDGTTFLHVASPAGDLLLKGDPGKESATDVTAAMKLAARSQAAAWACFTGGARPNLLSYDGRKLKLFTLGKDATFTATDVNTVVPPDLVNLLPVDTGLPATPGVVLATGNGITVLKCDGKGGFAPAGTREVPADLRQALGTPSRAIAADFDGDGLADIVQPFEKGGLFYAGTKDGGFAPPRACAVATSEGASRASIGDFDADGALDLLLAGQSGVAVYQNDGKGRFAEVLRYCGEVSYKAPPQSTWCDVGDFNNDGRPDFLLAYRAQIPIFYFNRGFRSFGLAVGLYNAVQSDETLHAVAGQQATILADLDADGAQDVVLVMASGEVWCLYNTNGSSRPARVRVRAPAGTCGPVSVLCTNTVRSLGRQVAQAGVREASFGICDNERGAATLSWQLPGQAAGSRPIKLEDRTIVIDLGKVPVPAGRDSDR